MADDSMSIGRLDQSREASPDEGYKARPRWQLLREIVKQPKGLIGVTIVGLAVFIALFGPWLASLDPYAQSFADTLQGPSAAHWFGTDQLGRDMFSRILTGARTSLGIGVSGVAFAFVVGVPIGILAAYRGGRVDFTVMRGVDVMLSFPDIVLALAIVAILGPSTQNVVLAVGIVSVPVFARTARAVTMSTMAEPYIEGSISLGCSPMRVVLRHILPNIAGILMTLSSLLFANTLLTASGLGFLGLGTQPPEPEWGTMLGESRSYIRSHPHMSTFPGLFLAVSALGFNLLGEALRTIYDPHAAKGLVSQRSLLQWMMGAKGFAKGLEDKAAAASADDGDEEPAPVETSDVKVAYLTGNAPLVVVRGVTLRIEPGRTMAIVGESGSGKSTLLRAIATLMPPGRAEIAGGSIAVDGQHVETMSPKTIRELRRKKIGVVFQDAASALNPVLTVGAQLEEAIRAGSDISASAARQRAIELLGDVKIPSPESRLSMYPHQFSGGMKQRIVIAMALAQDPAVLLADEPTSALDVTIQQQILSLLREIQRARGMAMLLVTHDLGLVARYADDVGVMYAGQLVEMGPVEDIFAKPFHPYTIALRESAPSLENCGESRILQTISGEPPNITRLPTGCSFHPRCPRMRCRTGCTTVDPNLRTVEGRVVACHHAEEAET